MEKETDTGRKRHRQIDRQTEKCTERKIGKNKHANTETESERERGRNRDLETGIDRESLRHKRTREKEEK